MLKIWSKYEDSLGGGKKGPFFPPLRAQRGLFVKSFKTLISVPLLTFGVRKRQKFFVK